MVITYCLHRFFGVLFFLKKMRILFLVILLILFVGCTSDDNKKNRLLEFSNPSKQDFDASMNPIKDSLLNYCNDRYSFCLSYPASFNPMGESHNGDGQSFITADGDAMISSYGSLAFRDEDFIWDLDTEYEMVTTSHNVITKEKSDEVFIVTYEAGNDFYHRTTYLRSGNHFGEADTKILNTLVIRFPKRKYEYYKRYIDIVQLVLNNL